MKDNWKVVFPDGREVGFHIPLPSYEHNLTVDGEFKRITGRDLSSDIYSLHDAGYKLLFIGTDND